MRFSAVALLVLVACSNAPASLTEADAEFMYRRQPDDLAGLAEITDLNSILAQTAAIVEGTVVSRDWDPDMNYAYTQYLVEDLVVHRGAIQPGPQPDWMIVQHYGGRKPDGTRSHAVGVPSFTNGERYLFLLRNRSWTYYPHLALPAIEGIPIYFRVAEEEGSELVLWQDEQALLGVSAGGFARGPWLYEKEEILGTEHEDRPFVRTDESIPTEVMSVQDVLAAIDGAGVKVQGEFYSEPSARWCDGVYRADESVWCSEK